MLYRTDELGTNGEALHFQHWADIVDCGYSWYRQNKVGGTTNANINSAMLYAFVDPTSEAGGISLDGWKTLWKYCADGVYSSDDDYKYGFQPLNKGDVQVSTFYSSSLYGKIDSAADSSENPLLGTMEPENWALVDIDDGTYYIVMEFVRGSDLKTAIQQRGAINQRKAAEIGAQVCQALTVAHNQDIIHRDIKPQNIMVQPDGNVKVMDFGIARAKNSVNDKTSAVLGTCLLYTSPSPRDRG